MPLPPPKPFRHLLIFGAIGSGKTSLAYHLTLKEARLIIVDTAVEPRYQGAGVIVYDVDSVAYILEEFPRFRIVFRPDKKEDLDWIFRLARAAQDVVILIEEVSQYEMSSGAGEDFKKTVVLGRHKNVKIVATTQRPADVHKILVAQSEIILGKLFETNDARYLRGMSGVTAETIERAAALPDPYTKGGTLYISYITPLDNEERTAIIMV